MIDGMGCDGSEGLFKSQALTLPDSDLSG